MGCARRHFRPAPRPGTLAGLLALGALLGCGGGDDAGNDDAGREVPGVVVTTSIWGDIVTQVAGGCAPVSVLIPAGADPHAFEPSARQVAELRDADLVVANGLGLEEGLEDTLQGAAEAGTPVVHLAPDLDPIPLGAEGTDPHVWQDPARVARAVPPVADALVAHARCGADAVGERADAVVTQLERLDAEVAERYAAVPEQDRVLVTNHDAFGYLADRYGFRVVGTIIPGGSTLAEPSAADLADLAAVIEAERVPAIFAETVAPTALADALAAEVGREVAVVPLYSDTLGEPGSGADTYAGMVRANAERITEALGSP